jgi:hypothetical protein
VLQWLRDAHDLPEGLPGVQIMNLRSGRKSFQTFLFYFLLFKNFKPKLQQKIIQQF